MLANWGGKGRFYRNTSYEPATLRSQKLTLRVRAVRDSATVARGLETEFGATAEVRVAGEARGFVRRRTVASSHGYLQQSDYALTFALPAGPDPSEPARGVRFDLLVDFPSLPVNGLLRIDRAVNPVLGELAAAMGPDAILATNTSSLSVAAIAEGLPHPERVVGMHFFNPPRKMPLVEIVRGPRTSEEVVRRVARLALELGKTPVITKDVAGFLVNRILGPYLDEAVRLIGTGVDPNAIDHALVAFGMPMGPCELIDEVGLDIAAHAGASLEKAYGERMRAAQVLAPLVAAGEFGKKSGKGIFAWRPGKGGKAEKDGVNARLASGTARKLDEGELVDRCVLAMANEAVRCLAEEVVDGPRTLDLATVFGTGFAPFRGGVLRYADARGLAQVVERLEALRSALQGEGERLGRYEPAPLLVERARAGKKLHD